MEVVEITAIDTHPLRRTVLRDGTASDEVVFDGDDLPTTFHLGVQDGGAVVAISTWLDRPHPEVPTAPGHQVRGMATEPDRRSEGLGGLLLTAGVERCASLGAHLVWARARLTAVQFYERHGFETLGSAYIDETTGLPHRDIVLWLDAGVETPG